MEKIRVNLTENQYHHIRDFYNQSLLEQCGVMYANLEGNNINIDTIDFFTPDMLEQSTEENLIISEESLYDAVLYAIGNNYSILIFVHTHPHKGSAYLSDADKKSLKGETKIFEDCKFDLLAIECVVNSKGLNFFVWDDKKDDAVRLDCYVGGVLEPDAEKKNFLQIFMDFKEGRYKKLGLGI